MLRNDEIQQLYVQTSESNLEYWLFTIEKPILETFAMS